MSVEPRTIDFSGACEVKTWRNHWCQRQHRSETTFIECVIGKRLCWVIGVGRFATISWCDGRRRARYVTVILHEDVDDARKAKAAMDSTGCGGRCQRKHDLVRIDRRGGGRNG